MNVAQVRVGDVRINLRRVDGGVAEELLDAPDIGAVREQVGREGVAERVRRYDVRDAGARDVRLQVSLDVAGNDAVQSARPAVDEERLLHIVSRFEVVAHGLFRYA